MIRGLEELNDLALRRSFIILISRTVYSVVPERKALTFARIAGNSLVFKHFARSSLSSHPSATEPHIRWHPCQVSILHDILYADATAPYNSSTVPVIVTIGSDLAIPLPAMRVWRHSRLGWMGWIWRRCKIWLHVCC